MSKKLFGTDGIRGEYGVYPLDSESIQNFGKTIAFWLNEQTHQPTIAIGLDPRESGPVIEKLLSEQFLKFGINVISLGILPTPALSFMTKHLKADLGIMISASHNPYQDNGIKLFKSNGAKLSDEEEHKIEELFFSSDVPEESKGESSTFSFAQSYGQFLLETLPFPLDLSGLKIALDCAHGATHEIAPEIFEKLGAELVKIGVNPDGLNINQERGSVSPEALCETVKEHNCHLGIAFDGDGDRVLFVDSSGELVNGDQLMAILSSELKNDAKKNLVATVMSNLGLEKYLTQHDINLVRTKVGDRYVYQAMIENGYPLGGEQSGHIIMLNYSPTGDGLLAALHILSCYVKDDHRDSFFQKFKPVPQELRSLRLKDSSIIETESFKNEIKKIQDSMKGVGRVFIRKSGTEELVRIMIECEDKFLLEKELQHILSLVSNS